MCCIFGLFVVGGFCWWWFNSLEYCYCGLLICCLLLAVCFLFCFIVCYRFGACFGVCCLLVFDCLITSCCVVLCGFRYVLVDGVLSVGLSCWLII